MGRQGVEIMTAKELREKLVVLAIGSLFLFGLGAYVLMSHSHGDFGSYYTPEDIDSSMIPIQGHIFGQSLPEDLLILGAGQEAVIDFEVYNKDPNNDIDTIQINIPGSEITNGTYEWYNPSFVHEWTQTISNDDEISFQARDDLEGPSAGDVAHYDVASNEDDALDFVKDFDDMDNPVYDLSEGITLTVTFNAPTTPGIMMEEDAIDLKVGDLKTESPGAPLTTFPPYPYPYIVAQNDDEYRIMVMKTTTCDLEVMYGDEHLFAPTRGSNYSYSDVGFKYIDDLEQTIVVLENSADTSIVPLVKAKEDGLTGSFSLDIYTIKFENIATGAFLKTSLASNYQDTIPASIGEVANVDIDGDGILNKLDPDMDGDGIPNDEDKSPETYDLPPIVVSKTDDVTLVEHNDFTLEVEASDPEMGTLTYNWTQNKDPEWSASGKSITLTGFAPGTYQFTVKITDELGNVRVEQVNVTINANQAPKINDIVKESESLMEGDTLVLSVNVTDTENDELTYVWKNDQDPEWTGTGNPITVTGLKAGTYRFTVSVSDGWSNDTSSIDISMLKVEEKEKEFPIWIIIVIIAVVLVIIVIVVFLLMKRKKKPAEAEDEFTPSAYPPGVEGGGIPPAVESSYMSLFEGSPDEISADQGTSIHPLVIEPEEPPEVAIMEARTDAGLMEFPDSYAQEPTPVEQPAGVPEEGAMEMTEAEPQPPVEEPMPEVEPAPEAPQMPPVPPAPAIPAAPPAVPPPPPPVVPKKEE